MADLLDESGAVLQNEAAVTLADEEVLAADVTIRPPHMVAVSAAAHAAARY